MPTSRQEFEKLWDSLSIRIREDTVARVPVDWPWDKRVAYWGWIAARRPAMTNKAPDFERRKGYIRVIHKDGTGDTWVRGPHTKKPTSDSRR